MVTCVQHELVREVVAVSEDDTALKGWVRRYQRLLRDAGPRFPEVVAKAENAPVETNFGPIQQPLRAQWSHPVIIPEIIGLAREGNSRREIYKIMYDKYEMSFDTTRYFIKLSSSRNP
jgi:hypothetical protein